MDWLFGGIYRGEAKVAEASETHIVKGIIKHG